MSVYDTREIGKVKIVMLGGAGSGSASLAGLTDTDITSPSNGQVLTYDSTSGKWENQDSSLPADPLPIVNGGTGNTAGYIRTGQRANTSVGANTTIEGTNNVATGVASHAEGEANSASGNKAHAEGTNCTASNTNAHAEGDYCTASGQHSHAQGAATTASGTRSSSAGYYVTAGYANQFCIGAYNDNKSTTLFEVGNGTAENVRGNALEVYSNGNVVAGGTITDGSGNSIPAIATTSVAGTVKPDGTTITINANGTISSQSGGMPENPLATSHGGTGNADGYIRTGLLSGATAGSKATSEGLDTQATGSYSHAEGQNTTASGYNAHAEGLNTTASGDQTHASGQYTVAAYREQFVIGRYNDNDSDSLLEVGNGTGTNARSNAFVVKDNGNVIAGGTITDGSGNSIPAIATTSVAGKVKPDGTTITIDANGVISSAGGLPADPLPIANGGTGNTAGYIRTGQKANTTIGTNATIEGANNTGSGTHSHVEGYTNTASNQYTHAEGNSTQATGQYAHSEGIATIASGTAAHAEGGNNTASGGYSHAEGYHTTASGNYSHAGGFYTVSGHPVQTVVGEYNDNKSNTMFEVGNGNSTTRSNALEVYKSGDVVVGNNITAAGSISDANGALNAVTANPSGTASTALTKLKVGADIYSISGGGSSTLSDLTDTSISSPTNGQVLKYNSTSSKWENSTDADTHRPIKVNGSQVLGDNTTALDLVAGTNVTLSESGGAVTIDASGSGSVMSKNRYALSGSSWSSSANSSGYYTYTLALAVALDTNFCPNISLAGSGSSVPTDTHKDMYRRINYFDHTSASSIILYAKTKPNSTFYIYVEGVNS